MKKRILSIVMALAMVLTMLPIETLAQHVVVQGGDGAASLFGEDGEDGSYIIKYTQRANDTERHEIKLSNAAAPGEPITYTIKSITLRGGVTISERNIVESEHTLRYRISSGTPGDQIIFSIEADAGGGSSKTLTVEVTLTADRDGPLLTGPARVIHTQSANDTTLQRVPLPVNSEAAGVVYSVRSVINSGTLKLSDWYINDGTLFYKISSGSPGDILNFVVSVWSTDIGDETLTITINLVQEEDEEEKEGLLKKTLLQHEQPVDHCCGIVNLSECVKDDVQNVTYTMDSITLPDKDIDIEYYINSSGKLSFLVSGGVLGDQIDFSITVSAPGFRSATLTVKISMANNSGDDEKEIRLNHVVVDEQPASGSGPLSGNIINQDMTDVTYSKVSAEYSDNLVLWNWDIDENGLLTYSTFCESGYGSLRFQVMVSAPGYHSQIMNVQIRLSGSDGDKSYHIHENDSRDGSVDLLDIFSVEDNDVTFEVKWVESTDSAAIANWSIDPGTKKLNYSIAHGAAASTIVFYITAQSASTDTVYDRSVEIRLNKMIADDRPLLQEGKKQITITHLADHPGDVDLSEYITPGVIDVTYQKGSVGVQGTVVFSEWGVERYSGHLFYTITSGTVNSVLTFSVKVRSPIHEDVTLDIVITLGENIGNAGGNENGGGTTPPAGGGENEGGTTPPAGDDENEGGTTPPAGDDENVGGTTPPAGDNDTPSTTPNVLLKDPVLLHTHPTHLSTGKIPLSGSINSEAGVVTYAKDSCTTKTGSATVTSWEVTADGFLTYTVSSGKTGDVIAFVVTVSSSNFSEETLEIVITLDYERLMITSGTTMTYGSTLKLTCAGQKGDGQVVYTVVDGTGKATVSGNVLTAVAAGTVKVTAVQLKDGDLAAEPSEPVTITITKATPTGSPSFTKLTHAGLTLADAKLTLNSFSVEGRVEWVLSDETIVVANTAYEWVFTPSDTQNYESIKGTITPYTVNDKTFAVGEGVTEENPDGSFTTITFGEDDSSYKLTEYPDGRITLVHTKLDGTVTTIEKLADGTRTETVVKKDGSKQITASDKSGITHTTITDRYGYATVQVYLPSSTVKAAVKSGSVIKLPIPEIPCTDDRSDAPVITFTLYTTKPVRVSIPVNSPTAGTVAITVSKNGRESIERTCTVGYDSVEFTLSGSTMIKVADLSKRFTDVDRWHWYKDAVDFATSRGLFNGVTPFEFNASGYMSRAMLVQVLHNLEGNPYYGYGGYYGYAKLLSDVEGKWYENSAIWAIVNGYISGYEDGTFRGELNITREQLAVILYRYAGYPPVRHYVNVSLTDYLDYQSISPYAYEAMYWALCSGVLYTAGRDKLSPQQPVTRAEVAQTFKNLVEFMVK